METLLLIYLGGSLLLALLALPMIARKLPPNSWYGVRIPQTLDDPKAWYAVNAYAGKRLLWMALLFGASALLLYNWPGLSVDAYAWLNLAILVVLFSFLVLQIWRYLKVLGS